MSAQEPAGTTAPDPLACLLDALAAIRDKIDRDQFHAGLVAKLHEEIEAHRRGAAEKLLLPLITGAVRMHADVSRQLDAIRIEPPERTTPERLAKVVADFRSDLELLLDHGGVTLFVEVGDAFDPRRQIAQRAEPTADSRLDGKIAHRLRPGFEYGGRVIEKERVAVYALAAAPAR